MATASQIILRGLKLIGDKVVGDTLTTNEQTDYLYVLNSMLDSWRIDKLLVFRIIESTFTLTTAARTYTIGTGGNFNIERPDRLEDTSFILFNNAEYFIQLVDEATFTAQQTTGQTQMPRMLYYDRAFPLGNIYFDYIPDRAYDFHLKSWSALQQFATINDSMTLPAGYQRALESNFAMEVAPGYLSASPELVKIAKESKAKIMAANTRITYLRMDVGVVQARHARSGNNILTGA
jgi:hypothetical protein